MNSFRNHRLRDFSVPMSTNWLLNDLAYGFLAFDGRQARA